ncbi:hypothetical protein DFH27DRAFT_535618 [Peziza echinospora]|nr:hypothetical protein DFH27DRAFT_535618 [Peziza echinospora]
MSWCIGVAALLLKTYCFGPANAPHLSAVWALVCPNGRDLLSEPCECHGHHQGCNNRRLRAFGVVGERTWARGLVFGPRVVKDLSSSNRGMHGTSYPTIHLVNSEWSECTPQHVNMP